jgi:hypothetical protein
VKIVVVVVVVVVLVSPVFALCRVIELICMKGLERCPAYSNFSVGVTGNNMLN